ncbi:MAG: biosynthetic peptidoglycan transglycosylase [Gammaproteobacteria bacterium]|nr:biosynthetic peptidoglycan transglycosylase [Gammaproteobacteria bacterium]
MKKWLMVFILVGFIAFFSYLVYLNQYVKKSFSDSQFTGKQVTQIEYQLEDYPRELINMLLLVEDQSFYEHWGIDFKEIIRVVYGYIFEEKEIRGASTITQQLIKNTLLTREKTFTRKIEEALMAVLLERSYNKNFILERYMNTVYLAQKGSIAFHGFAAASNYYFDKKVENLNLNEMAKLVALLKGPSYYNPFRYPERLNQRAEMILLMNRKYKKIVQ